MTENMENVYFKCYYGCNLDGSDDAQMAAEGVLNNKFAALDASQQEGIDYVSCESYAFNKESFTVHLAGCWYLAFCSELFLSLRLY